MAVLCSITIQLSLEQKRFQHASKDAYVGAPHVIMSLVIIHMTQALQGQIKSNLLCGKQRSVLAHLGDVSTESWGWQAEGIHIFIYKLFAKLIKTRNSVTGHWPAKSLVCVLATRARLIIRHLSQCELQIWANLVSIWDRTAGALPVPTWQDTQVSLSLMKVPSAV